MTTEFRQKRCQETRGRISDQTLSHVKFKVFLKNFDILKRQNNQKKYI